MYSKSMRTQCVKAHVAPAIHLPEAGHTRLHAEAAFVPLSVDAFDIPHRQGSRTNQAHLALEDVEELGQLVNAETSEEFADAGDARVILDLEDGARRPRSGFRAVAVAAPRRPPSCEI